MEKEKFKIEKFGTLFIFAIFAFFFILTTQLNEKIQAWPYFVTVLGMFLCALNLGVVVYKEKKGMSINAPAPLTGEELKIIAITLAVALVYIFAAEKIGYFVMTFLYVAGFAYYQNRKYKIWLYPLVAFCMCAAIYVGFKIFLTIPLPTGLLF